MIAQQEEEHVVFLENFDYTNSNDLIELQKFAIDYKSKHGRTTKYPFTSMLIVDKYYPVVDMLQFEGISVNIYFVNAEKPPRISKVDIFKKREKLKIKIPIIHN